MRRLAAIVSLLPLSCADVGRVTGADAGDTVASADAAVESPLAEVTLVMELPMAEHAAPIAVAPSEVRPPTPVPSETAISFVSKTLPNPSPALALVVASPEPAAEPAVRGELWASTAAEKRLRRAGPWTGVATAGARHDVLAVWSNRHVDVTVDDGASWSRALKSVRPSSKDSVALGDDGTLFVMGRGRRVGIRTPEGVERVTVAPFLRPGGALFSGAGWTGWIGPANAAKDDDTQVMALSRDNGATWSVRDAPDRGNFVGQASVDSDGTVAYFRASEWGCGGGVEELLVAPATGGPWTAASAAFEVVIDGVRGRDGWSYALASDCADDPEQLALCAWQGEEATAVTEVVLPSGYDRWKDTFIGAAVPAAKGHGAGASAALIVNGHLVLAAGASARVIAGEVPKLITALAADSVGRVHALSHGHLFRWSAVGGWRLL